MANYRLPDKNKNLQNRRTISERNNQPVTAPMGNYRLDSQGKPILPSSFEQSHDQENLNRSNIYSLNDYRNNQQTEYYSGPMDESFYGGRPSQNYRRDTNYQGPFVYTSSQKGQRINPNYSIPRYWLDRLPSKEALLRGFPKGKRKIFVLYLVIYSLMIGSAWQILPYNNVNRLIVSGNQIVQSESILNGVTIHSMDKASNVLKWRKEIEDHILTNNPLLEDVRIQRDSWKAIEIIVEEQKIVGIYSSNGKNYALMSKGYTSDEAVIKKQLVAEQMNRLPIIEGDFSESVLKQVAIAIDQFETSTLEKVEKITPSSKPGKEGYIEIQMKDGNLIKAVSSTVAEKMNYYPKMLDQLNGRKGIIDLEVGAYFTPEANETNSVKLNNN
ncbi:FtsQ-type POTRA domain-containing protein [Facklamia sp. 7083-14-GEN3]|uniref:FtsQ-type POTRA domain-containing protein n=1 Tax=Facklamia sp. 7083-14-GEN3 TaxID=2973478 RepID=UPI00215C872A|nr:FtsQ-type POTRA domain-containing protein [Facklamia sp. 7083-14-GEN3]MCR8969157.1 FtsQ-type POTRA domain-containing protein [Facklamia sp. 7083-14-GEN3]